MHTIVTTIALYTLTAGCGNVAACEVLGINGYGWIHLSVFDNLHAQYEYS